MSLKLKKNIAIIFIAVLSAFLVIFLVQPCFIQAKKAGEDLIAMEKESAALDAQIRNLQNFKPRYEKEIKPTLKISESFFMDPKDPVSFIGLMEETSAKNNLTINISSAQIFVPTNAADELWPSLNFQINLNGSLPSILNFMEKMTSLPNLVEIHGLGAESQALSQIQNQNETATALGEKAKKPAGLQQLASKNKVSASFNLKVYTK